MDIAFAVLLVLAAVGVAGYMSSKSRKKMDDYRRQMESTGEYVAPVPPQRMTRSQRRVEQMRASMPDIPKLSIEEIAKAEADDLGLGDVPGAEGLPVNVQLLVWRRDEDTRERCEGTVRYVTADGVAPGDATPDDVRLECDGVLRDPEASPQDESDDSGNNSDL